MASVRSAQPLRERLKQALIATRNDNTPKKRNGFQLRLAHAESNE
jgi:hypothetical protein